MRLFNISYNNSSIVVKTSHTDNHYDAIEFCKNNLGHVDEVTKKVQDILENNPDTVLIVKNGKYFTKLIQKIPGNGHILLFRHTGILEKYKNSLKQYRIYCDFYISGHNYQHFSGLKDQLIWVKIIYMEEYFNLVKNQLELDKLEE